MARRIVKHTYADGSSVYVIQTNRIFGFIPVPWRTQKIKGYYPCIYETLNAAMDTLNSLTLVKSEVIETRK